MKRKTLFFLLIFVCKAALGFDSEPCPTASRKSGVYTYRLERFLVDQRHYSHGAEQNKSIEACFKRLNKYLDWEQTKKMLDAFDMTYFLTDESIKHNQQNSRSRVTMAFFRTHVKDITPEEAEEVARMQPTNQLAVWTIETYLTTNSERLTDEQKTYLNNLIVVN